MKISITKLLAAGSLIFLCGEAFAQSGFEFGIRYGLQKTALLNESDREAGAELDFVYPKVYMSGGVALGYNISRKIGVEMDLLFSRQGQAYNGFNAYSGSTTAYNRQVAFQAFLNSRILIGAYSAKAELNVLKIPLLLKLSTNHLNIIYFTASAGPQLNMITKAVFEIDGVEVKLPGLDVEPTDLYRKNSVDAVLALGTGINFSEHMGITAQLRFDYGFSDVEMKEVRYSFMGAPPQRMYPEGRRDSHNATAGLMFGLNYKL